MLPFEPAPVPVAGCTAGLGGAGRASGWFLGAMTPSFVRRLIGPGFGRSFEADPFEFALGPGLLGGLSIGDWLGAL